MQLMPDTAKEVAKKQKIDLKTEEDVLRPETNIRLGLAYLRYLLDRFNGNHLLATVAYNAGPTRAKRWSERDRCLPSDVWVELIPFDQTRDYVQRVMSYTPIFEYLLVQHPDVDSMPLDKIKGKGCD
jgi:soluble lytic murein transglycosylase